LIERLHERARRIHESALVRAWEYRQRHYSKGVWHRLRRLLVDAEQAWIIEETEADVLEKAGNTPHPVGLELAPSKRLFFLGEDELKKIRTRRQIPVRLNSDFLRARSIALVPFDDLSRWQAR
jgi:hypothetical protein